MNKQNRKYRIYILILLVVSCAYSIVINEFAASSKTSLRVGRTFPDWIELYNPSDTVVNLAGFSITDDPSNPSRFVFPAISIEPDSYMIILGADDGISGTDEIILDFSLDKDGEYIGLYDSFGEVLDSFSFGPQIPDVTMGHPVGDTDSWTMFYCPTPGTLNDTLIGIGLSGEPSISPSSRFCISPFDVFISPLCARYSTDLSEPWTSGLDFSSPIFIDTTTAIRSQVREPGCLPGHCAAETYFFESLPDLPVLSITTDPRNLWNDTVGICVIGLDSVYTNFYQRGSSWERSARVQLINAPSDVVFDEPCWIRIHGGGSRSRIVKAFRFRFDDAPLDTRLFSSIERDKYSWLVVRHGGNDATSRIRTCISQLLGMRCGSDNPKFHAVRFYINGELWGLYHLKEYIDEEYARENFGPGDYDILTHGHADCGCDSVWWETVEYFETHDLSIDSLFDAGMELIDKWNFINYQIINIYAGNTDWPGKNETILRRRADHSEWKWIIWDTDFGFGCFSTSYSPIDHNTLAWAIRPEPMPELNPNPYLDAAGFLWSTSILRSSLANENFRNLFINRFADLLNTNLSADTVILLIDSLALAYERTQVDEYEYRGWWVGSWYSGIAGLRSFAEVRPGFVTEHILECFELDDTANVRVEPVSGGRIAVNTLPPVREGFEGTYFAGIPVRFHAIPDPGYRFVSWGYDELPNLPEVSIDPAGGIILSPDFTVTEPVENLYINELMALNDTTIHDEFDEYDDWVELYYAGDTIINLNGYGISDKADEPHRYVFDDDLFISPGEYLIIWTDGDDEQGVRHTDFRLSGDGEWIGISAPLSWGGEILDSMSFPALEGDIAYGRFCDGCDSLGILPYPTPGSSNCYVGISETTELPGEFSFSAYPNPFNSAVRIAIDGASSVSGAFVEIFDIAGRRIDKIDIESKQDVYSMDDTQANGNERTSTEIVWRPEGSVPSGIYLVRASLGDESASKRIVYMK